jgi:hypothetical protein
VLFRKNDTNKLDKCINKRERERMMIKERIKSVIIIIIKKRNKRNNNK